MTGPYFFFGGPAPQGETVSLSQRIDLADDITKLIADGELGMEFAGFESSAGNGDDPHRVRAVFYDDDLDLDDPWETDWTDGPSGWNPFELVDIPHEATSEVEVYLECRMLEPTNCSAMFEDLSLTFFYPPD